MKFASIQELYPQPPVRRYHRLAPRIEQQIAGAELPKIDWLQVALGFLAGYLFGSRRQL